MALALVLGMELGMDLESKRNLKMGKKVNRLACTYVHD